MANPFAIWNTVHRDEMGNQVFSEPAPSIYGALPFAYPTDSPPLMSFAFTNFNPSIASCIVLGPNGSPQFRVLTDPLMPGYTMVKTTDGKSCALIEWGPPAKVEIRGTISKQPASNFLRPSLDGRYRIMVIGSREFMWFPDHGHGTISLYTVSSSENPEFLGRISRSGRAIRLDMTQNAVRAGLLQACITATVLLQNGQNID
ncbi:hypothetical protein GYMLUDRAFT_220969 [Collybiopsis luxurians FD-317 M1]|nr:hypothetical protein GYMLUDRAFT_220969 [Collybiopsis luxurians FD-317 M1]